MNYFNIYSININGLRGKDRQLYLKNFINTNNYIDILCIQETQIDSYFCLEAVRSCCFCIKP